MNKFAFKKLLRYFSVALISSLVTIIVITAFNFSDIYLNFLLKHKYYGDVDFFKAEECARTSKVAFLLDEHSFYIPKEYGFDSILGQTTGQYDGIGISVVKNEDKIIIKYVMPETPAEKAGLCTGDEVVEVNGIKCRGRELEEVTSIIRGELGEKIEIKVLREVKEKNFSVKVGKIKATSVTSKKLENNIGYIAISNFDDDVDKEIENNLNNKLKDVEGLIIDLRDNPGGLLETAVQSLNLFIDKGTLIITKYDSGKTTKTVEAEGRQKYKMPIVVLTNKNSASASEFFTAAIKDNKRGISVGTLTYGKGSIQKTYYLGNNTGVHLTIGRFFTPNGKEIDKVGISPDVEVENASEYEKTPVSEIPDGEDKQLLRAIEELKSL